jgi:hypothetical protein
MKTYKLSEFGQTKMELDWDTQVVAFCMSSNKLVLD